MNCKGKELKHGQYCIMQARIQQNLLARIVEDNIAFFNSKIDLSVEQRSRFDECDTQPLSFQEAVIKLIEHCAEKNQPVPSISTKKIPAKNMDENQFFFHEELGVVGFVYSKSKALYFNDDPTNCWNYINDIGEVIPITIHQAAILLFQYINES